MADLIQCPLCSHEQVEGAAPQCEKCGLAFAPPVRASSQDIDSTIGPTQRPVGPSGLEEFFGPQPEPTGYQARSDWPLPPRFRLDGERVPDRSLPGVYLAKVFWNTEAGERRQCVARWFTRRLELSVYQNLTRLTEQTKIDEIVPPVHWGGLENGLFSTILIEPDLSATSLRAWLNENRSAKNKDRFARDVLRSLASAIGCLHEGKLCHLNLRPEIIEVCDAVVPVRARLGGFSRLWPQSELKLSHEDFYLQAYIAPEQDVCDAGPYSDFWSLGVVLFELVTGRHPLGHDGHLLEDAGVNQWLRDRGEIDYSSVPEQWEQLLRGLLTHNVNERWGIAEVNAFLRGGKLPAPPAEYETSLPLFKLAQGDSEQARTPEELAHLIATRWRQALSLANATIVSDWLRKDRKHEELAADVAAIERARGTSLDLKLIEIIKRLAPDQPPTYMGYALRTVGDLHALAKLALSDTAPVVDEKLMPPAAVIQSLFQERVIGRFPRNSAGGEDLLEVDSTWRAQVSEYQALRKGAGGAATELAPPHDHIRTLAFLLASVTDVAFFKEAQRQVDFSQEALETPWYWHLRASPYEPSPARLWLLQSVVGQATREAPAHREARRAEEERAVRSEIARRNEARAEAFSRFLNVAAFFPGAVVGMGVGLVAGLIIAFLVWIPTALVAWIASVFTGADTGNVADNWANAVWAFSMPLFAIAGAVAAYRLVASRGSILRQFGMLSVLAIAAGAVWQFGAITKVAELYEEIAREPTWNQASDCGKSSHVMLAAGEARCSFKFDTDGVLYFKDKRLQPSPTIPVGTSAALRPKNVAVHLATSPDRRFVLVDAFNDARSARYLLDTNTNQLRIVIRDAVSAGRFRWSSNSASIANFTNRDGQTWVEMLRLADGQTGRWEVPRNEQVTGFEWTDAGAFVVSLCTPARGGNPRQCRKVTLTYPDRSSSPSSAADPRTPRPAVFHIGAKVRVNGNEVNVRSGPNRTSPVIGRVNVGLRGEVRSAPVVQESISWYRVVFNNGLDGWIAGRYLAGEQR